MTTMMELPMLSVNACKLGKVDPSNVGSVAKIWSVFSKSNQAECLEDGKRLENMMWRTMSRQTLCSNPKSSRSIATSTVNVASSRPSHKEVPDLSTSTSTIASDASTQFSSPQSSSDATATMPSSPKSPTLSSSKDSDSLLRPLDLEKMVSSIQEKQEIEPLSPSINSAVPKTVPYANASAETNSNPATTTIIDAPNRSSDSSASTAARSGSESERSSRPSVGSDTSAELLLTTVVRGFSPGSGPSSYRSNTHLAPAPASSKSIPKVKLESNQKGGGFFVGGSSEEAESSFEDRMSSQPTQSSLTAGLKKPVAEKKKLSFRDVVESRKLNEKSHEDEEVFESDDEDDVSDSAIDDSEDEAEDDDEAWEDDAEGDGDNADKPLFKRVDSQPNLVSRRSLLTSGLNQGDRAAAFQDLAISSAPGLKRSKTSANVTSEEGSTLAPNNLPRTPSKPILRTRSDLVSLVSSPKTTRRNMLSTEIDENLRKSILHERLQKKSTLNAYTKRVQSARNLTTLSHQIQPEDVASKSDDDEERTYDPYGQGIGAYHQAGW